jgi:hypothetical protein
VHEEDAAKTIQRAWRRKSSSYQTVEPVTMPLPPMRDLVQATPWVFRRLSPPPRDDELTNESRSIRTVESVNTAILAK